MGVGVGWMCVGVYWLVERMGGVMIYICINSGLYSIIIIYNSTVKLSKVYLIIIYTYRYVK